MATKKLRYVIKWTGGVYGEATNRKGIYTMPRDRSRLVEDFEQCVFLQPENKYEIELVR